MSTDLDAGHSQAAIDDALTHGVDDRQRTWRIRPFVRGGELLTPGMNVDLVDVGAGLRMAARIGYGDPKSVMVIEYGLHRWARGEERDALGTMMGGGVDLTSAYMIVAAARAACCQAVADGAGS